MILNYRGPPSWRGQLEKFYSAEGGNYDIRDGDPLSVEFLMPSSTMVTRTKALKSRKEIYRRLESVARKKFSKITNANLERIILFSGLKDMAFDDEIVRGNPTNYNSVTDVITVPPIFPFYFSFNEKQRVLLKRKSKLLAEFFNDDKKFNLSSLLRHESVHWALGAASYKRRVRQLFGPIYDAREQWVEYVHGELGEEDRVNLASFFNGSIPEEEEIDSVLEAYEKVVLQEVASVKREGNDKGLVLPEEAAAYGFEKARREFLFWANKEGFQKSDAEWWYSTVQHNIREVGHRNTLLLLKSVLEMGWGGGLSPTELMEAVGEDLIVS